jgi:hypothetical protein
MRTHYRRLPAFLNQHAYRVLTSERTGVKSSFSMQGHSGWMWFQKI